MATFSLQMYILKVPAQVPGATCCPSWALGPRCDLVCSVRVWDFGGLRPDKATGLEL